MPAKGKGGKFITVLGYLQLLNWRHLAQHKHMAQERRGENSFVTSYLLPVMAGLVWGPNISLLPLLPELAAGESIGAPFWGISTPCFSTVWSLWVALFLHGFPCGKILKAKFAFWICACTTSSTCWPMSMTAGYCSHLNNNSQCQ